MKKPAGFLDTLDTAVHEASHATVTIKVGLEFKEVWADGDEGAVVLGDWWWVSPLVGGSLRRVRKLLTVNVAGQLGEDLWKEWMAYGGQWATPEDEEFARILGEPHPHPLRVSTLLRGELATQLLQEDESDFSQAYDKIFHIALSRLGRDIEATRDAVERSSMQEVIESSQAEELLLAERRAERILKRNWSKVLQLGHSLARRKSGRMTYKEVARLICPLR
jgi:hypothetical protein